jgi:glycosyltransferase involved in cell wall biosynthesis
MKVFVVERDGGGGLIHYAYQMCSALAQAGAEVTLVTSHHYELAHLPHAFKVEPRIRLWNALDQSLPASKLGSALVRTMRKARRVGRAIRYAIAWHRLTNYLIAERPDVIQFSAIHFSFQRIFLRRLHRAGLTLTQICHEFEPRERSNLTKKLSQNGHQKVFETFDLIYLHGPSNRGRFHEIYDIPLRRTRSIPHGNEELFLSLGASSAVSEDSSVPEALFFGGLRPSKGIEDLIDAWELVRFEIDARLRICGQAVGLDPVALRDRIERVGVAVSVEIDPHYQPAERVAQLMNRADVVVLPYRSATASGVLQVAYTFGVPVVATAVGTLAEDVIHGETGLLVEPGDVDGLARALIKMLSDRPAARRMGEAARRASARFSWEPIARSILADYEELPS